MRDRGDRSSSASIDDMVSASGELISHEALEPGDVLLFSSENDESFAIQFFDDCIFDHVALVVSPPEDDSSGKGPWICDVGITKQRIIPLRSYAMVPKAVLVRRHRIPSWRMAVNNKTHELIVDVEAYDFDRLLLVMFTSLVRFSPQLKQLGERPRRPADPARFVGGIHFLMALIGQNNPQVPRKRRHICVTLLAESFDVGDHEPMIEGDSYYGLHVPERPTGGLLEWVASGEPFLNYLANGESPYSGARIGFDPNALLHKLYSAYGFPSTRLFMRPGEDFDQQREEDLKRAVVNATDALLRLLGWNPNGKRVDVSPKALQATAMWMLDELLKHRHVLTQSDIMDSKSLYDVGFLDVGKVDWLRAHPRHPGLAE
jgi:hypothetical protein